MTYVGIILICGPFFPNPLHPTSPSLNGRNSCVAASSIGNRSMNKLRMRLATAKSLKAEFDMQEGVESERYASWDIFWKDGPRVQSVQ